MAEDGWPYSVTWQCINQKIDYSRQTKKSLSKQNNLSCLSGFWESWWLPHSLLSFGSLLLWSWILKKRKKKTLKLPTSNLINDFSTTNALKIGLWHSQSQSKDSMIPLELKLYFQCVTLVNFLLQFSPDAWLIWKMVHKKMSLKERDLSSFMDCIFLQNGNIMFLQSATCSLVSFHCFISFP